MVQALIDIENEITPFRYPGSGHRDADRNVDELIVALPD